MPRPLAPSCPITVLPMLIALSASCADGQAQSMNFVIEDAPITGTPEAPQAYEFFFPWHGASITIELDMIALIEAPSLGSELNLVARHESGFELIFDGSDENAHDLGPADIILGFDDAPGPWSFRGSVDISGSIPDIHGVWTIETYDEFDSLPGPEGTLHAVFTVWVPTPGTGLLVALGFVATARRCRRA
jgi:hypothetical protein